MVWIKWRFVPEKEEFDMAYFRIGTGGSTDNVSVIAAVSNVNTQNSSYTLTTTAVVGGVYVLTMECFELKEDSPITGLQLLTPREVVVNNWINTGHTMTVVGKCTNSTITARCLSNSDNPWGPDENPIKSALILMRIS